MISFKFNPREKRVFTCGQTGKGKTTFASQIYKKLDTLCIFVNTNEERIPERASQTVVYSVDDIAKAINLGGRKICLNPKGENEIEPKEIARICSMLMRIGRKMKKQMIFSHVFVDEVQEYSSLHRPYSTIDRIWKRGRRYGVVGHAISQRPADVSHTILTQSEYHVIFRLGTYEIPYFKRYGIPIEEHEEWLKKEYHFIVFDGIDTKRFYPVRI